MSIIAVEPMVANFDICNVVSLVKSASVICRSKQVVQNSRARLFIVLSTIFDNSRLAPSKEIQVSEYQSLGT